MSSTRPLPQKLNPLLTQEDELPNYSDLVGKRRLHQSVLRDPNVVLNYVYLGVPIPRVLSGVHKSKRDTHYLMRRSGDGFVSATAMFKATFPWASIPESDLERDYVRQLPGTSDEETAGNVWVTPTQALKLAQEYRIKYWIRALLDPARYAGARTAPDGTTIPAPPKFNLGEYDAVDAAKADTPEDSEEASDADSARPSSSSGVLSKEKPRLAPPTPPSSFSRNTRSRRSVSPQKSRRTPAASSATPRTRSSARIRAQSREPHDDNQRQQSLQDDLTTYEALDQETASVQELVIKTIEEEEVASEEAEHKETQEEEDKVETTTRATKTDKAQDEEDEETEPETEVVTETVETKVVEVVAVEAGEEIKEADSQESQQEEEEAEAETEPTATIHIHKEVVVDEATGERTETSHVELEPAFVPVSGVPPTAQEVAEMLAEAKAMVARGTTEDADVAADATPSRSTLDSKSKRKAEEISRGADEMTEIELPERTKRARVEEEPAAVQIKKQHIRKRALFGIGMTVAIGALSTWATAIF